MRKTSYKPDDAVVIFAIFITFFDSMRCNVFSAFIEPFVEGNSRHWW